MTRAQEMIVKDLQKMTVAEWNEFARNCRWAIIEPAYEFESEEERAEVQALINELEDFRPKKQFSLEKIFGHGRIRFDRGQDRRNEHGKQ